MIVNGKTYRKGANNVTYQFATCPVAMREPDVPEVVALWKDFGERVRSRRDELGWSQDAAGERVGMTRQQWNRIEAGIGTKRSTVYRIANALQLPVAIVLDWAGFKVPGAPLADDEVKLGYYYRDLSDEDRARLLAIAETFWKRSREFELPLPPEGYVSEAAEDVVMNKPSGEPDDEKKHRDLRRVMEDDPLKE